MVTVMTKGLVQRGTITPGRWLGWQARYAKGDLRLSNNFVDREKLGNTPENDFVRAGDVYGAHRPVASYQNMREFMSAFPPETQAPVGMLMLGGGYGGRLFGYGTPEADRIKILAPVLTMAGRKGLSPLDVRLEHIKRLRANGFQVLPSIMANDVNSERIAQAVEKARCSDFTRVFPQVGLPRVVPAAEDLAKDTKFAEIAVRTGKNPVTYADKVVRELGSAGDVLLTRDGQISRKPAGHLDGLTMYFLAQMQRDMRLGAKVCLINCGEEIGFIYNPPLINWVMANPKPLTFIFHSAQISKKGGGVFKYNGRNQVLDGCQIDQSKGFPDGVGNITKNLFEVAVHIPSFLAALGLTESGFLGMKDDQLVEVLERKVYSRLNPIIEIKPVGEETGGLWGAQMIYLFGQATSIFDMNMIMGDKDTFPFPELKDEKGVPGANAFISSYYEPFLR